MDAPLRHGADHEPAAEPHVVYLYRRPDALHRGVVRWIGPTLRRGGGALLICTPANAAMVRVRMAVEGINAEHLERENRLVILPAEETIASLFRDDVPDREAFERFSAEQAQQIRGACAGGDAYAGGDVELRGWGEMVDLLWRRGRRSAAYDLEILWNQAVAKEGIRVLCSYDVTGLDHEGHANLWADVSSNHGRVLYDASNPMPDGPRAVPAALLAAMDRDPVTHRPASGR